MGSPFKGIADQICGDIKKLNEKNEKLERENDAMRTAIDDALSCGVSEEVEKLLQPFIDD